MAFPTTSVLDNFNRANSTGLGANWTNDAPVGDSNFDVVSNQAGTPNHTFAFDYWNVASYGPDCEVYATVAVKPTGASDHFELFARFHVDASGNGVGYAVKIAFPSTVTLLKYNGTALNGGAATVLATFTQTVAAGDAIGMSIAGTTLTAYYKASGGSWVSLGTATDATFTGADRLAMAMGDAGGGAGRVDDFSGGTIIAGAPSVSQAKQRRRRGALRRRRWLRGVAFALANTAAAAPFIAKKRGRRRRPKRGARQREPGFTNMALLAGAPLCPGTTPQSHRKRRPPPRHRRLTRAIPFGIPAAGPVSPPFTPLQDMRRRPRRVWHRRPRVVGASYALRNTAQAAPFAPPADLRRRPRLLRHRRPAVLGTAFAVRNTSASVTITPERTKMGVGV